MTAVTVLVFRDLKEFFQDKWNCSKHKSLKFSRDILDLEFMLSGEVGHSDLLQSNFNGSNTFGTMEISSRQG